MYEAYVFMVFLAAPPVLSGIIAAALIIRILTRPKRRNADEERPKLPTGTVFVMVLWIVIFLILAINFFR